MSSSSSSDSGYTLPSTLTSPPVAALVPPGQCQFGPDALTVPLLARTAVSSTSYVLRFGLPHSNQPLNLSTCACLLARATNIPGHEEKGTITRPYTPISTNAQIGSFDLLVKDYGPVAGTMSKFLCQDLRVGDSTSVSFLHLPLNVKTQAPFDAHDRICMLVGGAGITPMIQALHAILGDSSRTDEYSTGRRRRPVVTLLYGSRTSNDILGKELLDQWAAAHPDQLRVIYTLSHEPDDSGWTGRRGMIDRALIAEHAPLKSDDAFQIWICGPPPMYQALSGPREEPHTVSGLLGEMGYTAEQVYKF